MDIILKDLIITVMQTFIWFLILSISILVHDLLHLAEYTRNFHRNFGKGSETKETFPQKSRK